MRKITCHCEQEFTVDFPENVSIDENPDLIQKIKDGMFLSCICPVCNAELNTEFRTRIFWSSKNVILDFLPEIERFAWLRDHSESETMLQTVIGYPELADRVAVLDSALEPIVIEAIKYYLLVSARESTTPHTLSIVFEKITDNNELEFHIHGLKDDEIALTRLPMDVYESMLKRFMETPEQEPFPSLVLNSYISVQNVSIEE